MTSRGRTSHGLQEVRPEAALSLPGRRHGAREHLPLWLKMPSISMLLLEWAMHKEPQGTRPSAAGDRSVVRTKHQSGLSWGRSKTSTVWPRRMVSSALLQAVKSWITTVSSQPPDSWGGYGTGQPARPRQGPAAGEAGAHAQLRQGAGRWLSGGPQASCP